MGLAFRGVSGVLALFFAVMAPARLAHAQSTELDTQLFLPTPAVGTTFTIDRPTVPRHGTVVVGLGTSFARGLLIRGSDGVDIVAWRAQAEALVALGLFEWIEIGAALPLTVARTTSDPFADVPPLSTVVRPGDARLTLKVPIVRGDFGLAARGVVTLPSGDGTHFLGTDYWTLTPSLVAAQRLGSIVLGAEVGYRMRRRAVLGDLEYDDELHAAVGIAAPIVDRLEAIAETHVRVGLGGRTVRSNEIPMEAGVGLRYSPIRGLTVEVGGGTGLLAGYGAPTYRVFATLRWASERAPCAEGPEDYDGYQDGDFCADPDNDGDGIPDVLDQCPNDPEDFDGFEDEDGCPDPDNDGDGILDEDDPCPLESEDLDGFQDADGCPDLDNDEDGIPDGLDQCPMEPEDPDGFQDEDGCPEPGPERPTVTVTDTRILISERIYFDFDRDTIRSVSMPLLDQVADVIGEIPARRRVRVEGYTDGAGNPKYNLDLSYRRARSVVEYLVSRGVPRDRLEYVGYGSKGLVAPDDSAEGRALNRRVEFTILEPTDKATDRRRR